MATRHPWQFTARFRRNAFGWKSAPAIQRLKEAVAEIRSVAKSDPALGAEGTLVLFEKLVPAIEQVDGSSGSMGNAVHKAIDALVPVFSAAPWSLEDRQARLQRLWAAVLNDEISYIETLADRWGELCVDRELALRWANELRPMVEFIWSPSHPARGHSKAIPACLSCMSAASLHEELLALIDKAPFKWWNDRQWGFKALVAMGRRAEALRYAEESKGINEPMGAIARACEQVLLDSGMVEEAYRRYALVSHRSTTHLATFRAIAKQYPSVDRRTILRDLIAASAGQEGKWFAAAKDAGFLDMALELAAKPYADPKTLNRAARDLLASEPAFSLSVAWLSMRAVAMGYGFEITSAEVHDAWRTSRAAADALGMDEPTWRWQLREALSMEAPALSFVHEALQQIDRLHQPWVLGPGSFIRRRSSDRAAPCWADAGRTAGLHA